MCLARLRFAVFIAILVSHTVAEARPNALKGVVSKVLPVVTSAALLFMPLSLDAVPNYSVPALPPMPALRSHTDQQATWGEEYIGRSVFFTRNGVGQRGLVVATDGSQVEIIQVTGKTMNGEMLFEEIQLPVDQIEAFLHWDYSVVGNFVVFTPVGSRRGLEMEKVVVPQVRVLADGNLEIEGGEEQDIALGVITAVTQDARYLIKPYHYAPFAADHHHHDSTNLVDHIAHADPSHSPLAVKHVFDPNTGIHLVPQDNIFSGLQHIMIEETEINAPFFSSLANEEHVTQEWNTEAADLVGELIYYDVEGSKYLAQVIAQHGKQVEVRLPGSNNTRHIHVEQIRAVSVDDSADLGGGVSFLAYKAFPLYHSVQWLGRRLPGGRGGVWEEKVINGSIAGLLSNGLLLVKVVSTSVGGVYTNYELYIVHMNSGIVHSGNHHHRLRR